MMVVRSPAYRYHSSVFTLFMAVMVLAWSGMVLASLPGLVIPPANADSVSRPVSCQPASRTSPACPAGSGPVDTDPSDSNDLPALEQAVWVPVADGESARLDHPGAQPCLDGRQPAAVQARNGLPGLPCTRGNQPSLSPNLEHSPRIYRGPPLLAA